MGDIAPAASIDIMPALSVIIPALNEAAGIVAAIRSVRTQGPGEIIVVDGGSADGTPVLAGEADVVLVTERGRARQMNAGASRAQGDILLFLHADCWLAPGALAQAARVLANPEIVAGCFAMQIHACGALYRAIEASAAARVRIAGLIYGDQGLFLRTRDFHRLGGFPPLHFMEDLFFSRRLRCSGRVVVAAPKVHVSPRRWQNAGIIRQMLRNWRLTALAAAGVHPDRLADRYPAHGERINRTVSPAAHTPPT